MLSREENELLTQVGRGTSMGELLRRYWYPVAACSELSSGRPKRCGYLAKTWFSIGINRGDRGSSARNARTGACRWFWEYRKRTVCAVPIMAGSTTETVNVSSNRMSKPKIPTAHSKTISDC